MMDGDTETDGRALYRCICPSVDLSSPRVASLSLFQTLHTEIDNDNTFVRMNLQQLLDRVTLAN